MYDFEDDWEPIADEVGHVFLLGSLWQAVSQSGDWSETNLFWRHEYSFKSHNAPQAVLDAKDAASECEAVDRVPGSADVAPDGIWVSKIAMPDDSVNGGDEENTKCPKACRNRRNVASSPMRGDGEEREEAAESADDWIRRVDV